ncbi:hypothetical protein LEP1GSC012_2680 [Leptospira interrogans serovar Valbuzzi str. Valbuzzi]|nr:hypothetical protein LEP1GSC012_2680 [Leptospira interrogans serovar Valbuzzi str. Valbuzzi]
MSLFTCKKYVFLIKKTFSPPPHPKIGKTQHNAFLWVALENSAQCFPMGRVGKLSTMLSYGSRWKTQHNAFLWVALENSAQCFPMGRVGKLSTMLSYGSRWKTQHNAFLWVALENSAQRFPMGRVGKLSTTLSYGSRCRVGTKFYRRFCRNSDRFTLRFNYLWVRLWIAA